MRTFIQPYPYLSRVPSVQRFAGALASRVTVSCSTISHAAGLRSHTPGVGYRAIDAPKRLETKRDGEVKRRLVANVTHDGDRTAPLFLDQLLCQ
jgi:hypothetical protein